MGRDKKPLRLGYITTTFDTTFTCLPTSNYLFQRQMLQTAINNICTFCI